ncbi:MAG: diamine N-acetyltransferase, partial [Clostridium butyricum]|nr:diamine N-acetyltransferase [Clostridium butyricum]
MKLKLAEKNDLNNLKATYKEIIENMNKSNIDIWDE